MSITTLTQRELVIARLHNVRSWLNSALGRLKPELLDWAPARGMRTVSGQLVELIEVEARLAPWLSEGRKLTEAEVAAIVGDPQNLNSLLNALTKVRKGTLDCLSSLTDEELSSAPPPGEQWFGTLWVPGMPRSEHFMNISEHEYYHTGQLIAYLWFKGDEWEPDWFDKTSY